jgi:AGZA family xanthine/uracil permease-like MFS transporter
MIPGTAIGVLVGDLLFFWLAFKLAARTGRQTVTAMPLGLDTPSTFGMVFFVLGPAYLAAKTAGMTEEMAASHTWHIGICAIFISGIFKFVCAVGSNQLRQLIPRAGLLGSLTAVALVLISFLPLLEILHSPIVGLMALAIILTTLIGRVPLPFRIPGALGALLVSGILYYVIQALESSGILPPMFHPEHVSAGISHQTARDALFPTEWLTVFRFEWLGAMQDTLPYLPIIIPFALGTVVGGIDCTESAAAAGDEYDTGTVIGIEAGATLIASLCGGVIQTTPYIGHPAYKAMGGRAAYTLATALFIGSAGVIGYFAFLYQWIPKPTVFPILIFVGLEITAQSFYATPKRHYTAVALACVPALAALAYMTLGRFMGATIGVEGPEALGRILKANTSLAQDIDTLRVLSNGFIITSLLWSSALAAAIDRRLFRSSVFFGIAALFALFGVIHSPLESGAMYLPWTLDQGHFRLVAQYTTGYALIAVLLAAWGGHLWFHGWGITPAASDDELVH